MTAPFHLPQRGEVGERSEPGGELAMWMSNRGFAAVSRKSKSDKSGGQNSRRFPFEPGKNARAAHEW
jgi:hypothetical protein